MGAVSLNVDSQLNNSFQALQANEYDKVSGQNSARGKTDGLDTNKINNSAVNVSISMESLKVFLNIKSVEYTQINSGAQNTLMNIINNTELYDFLSGKEIDGGFSLKSIGYQGKAITELTPDEAKELISDDGFFGVSQTSQRVSSFVIGLAGDDLEALQEVRRGVIQGFEEAEKMWGGKLPEISYQTQEETLKIIDEKINELLKTDSQKELEQTDSNTLEKE